MWSSMSVTATTECNGHRGTYTKAYFENPGAHGGLVPFNLPDLSLSPLPLSPLAGPPLPPSPKFSLSFLGSRQSSSVFGSPVLIYCQIFQDYQ